MDRMCDATGYNTIVLQLSDYLLVFVFCFSLRSQVISLVYRLNTFISHMILVTNTTRQTRVFTKQTFQINCYRGYAVECSLFEAAVLF